MRRRAALHAWLVSASLAALANASTLDGADSMADLIAEGRVRSRQLRLTEADAVLRRALTVSGTPDQVAFAHLMLGVVAHQRRSTAAAETEYRSALDLASSEAIRMTARENLDLLATDVTRFAGWHRQRIRLDRWLVVEVALVVALAAAFVAATRPRLRRD